MKTTTKKLISWILTLTLAVTMCVEIPAFAYADEDVEAQTQTQTQTESAALTVEDNNGKVLGSFTTDDLKEIESAEGSKTYKFSAWNANPTYKPFPNVGGPTIKGILENAGVNVDSLLGNTLIKMVGSDTAVFTFTKDQLLGTRYYYPNAEQASSRNGAAPAAAYAGKVEVPAIINTYADNGRLMYGQLTPNEQNYSAYCTDILDGGKIVIGGTTNAKWNVMKPANFQNGGYYATGTQLMFDMNSNSTSMGIPKFWVHYTVDGSSVNQGSTMYNYDKWGDLKPIVVNRAGAITIKVRVYGHGKYDGDEARYTVYGVKIATTKIKSAKAGKKNVNIKWKKTAGADGYRIYRATSSKGVFKAIKTIKKGKTTSFNNKKLKRKKTYYYKIATLKKVNKKYIEGGCSRVIKAKTK